MADIIYKINNKGTDYNMASAAYCTCATAAATAAKVANLQDSNSNTFAGGSIPTGVTIHVKFTYSNTASNPTLNVNGSGAKSIMRYGTTAVGTDAKTSWRAGAIVSFTYDGTNWVMNTGIDDNTTYTIPTVNNATLTLNVGGQAVSGNNAFTANDATNTTYNVPSATASAYGVVKVSSVNSTAVTVNSESTTEGRYYPVELNSDGKAIVNVPWTDTDTKNTAGSTNSASKLFLVGATSQAANPQTYSNSSVYATNGNMNATSFTSGTTSVENDGFYLNQGNLSITADDSDNMILYSDGGTVYVNSLVADSSIKILDDIVATQEWVRTLLNNNSTLGITVSREFNSKNGWITRATYFNDTVKITGGNKSTTINIPQPAQSDVEGKSNRIVVSIYYDGTNLTTSNTRTGVTVLKRSGLTTDYALTFTSPTTSSGVHKLVVGTSLMSYTLNFKLSSTTYLD